jgi:anthranilate synthase component 2
LIYALFNDILKSYVIGRSHPDSGVAFFYCRGIVLAKLLVLDNYDSFTYNLVQMFMPYDLVIEVHRSDKISINKIKTYNPDYVLISPGPKDPAHAGISTELIKTFCDKIPILGVCLGMQCINEAFGGKTVRAPMPIHGKTSKINHTNQGLFKGVPSPLCAARYHSLMVKTIHENLIETAHSQDGVIMGLSHRLLPLHGVQFHPESFLTENGALFVENFLRLGPLSGSLNYV